MLTLVLCGAAAAGAPTAWAASPGPAPPLLVGELGDVAAHVPANGEVRHSCAADGSGELRYRMSGVASGPFPGTFSETGTATFGPAVFGSDLPLSQIERFKASFTITSPAGQIKGTKTATGPGSARPGALFPFANMAICGPEPAQPSLISFIRTLSLAEVCYEATITTPSRTTKERGGATLGLSSAIFFVDSQDFGGTQMTTFYFSPATSLSC